jgi:hypothetical protein
MMRMNSGLRIMDRAFLDLFAFSKNGDRTEIKRKALELKDRIQKHNKPLENGQLVFLAASEEAIEERLLRRGSRNDGGKSGFEPKTLAKQKEYLKKIYRVDESKILDTSHLLPGEVARVIARKIFLEQYEEFDFSERLDEIIAADGVL